jgi:tetratricopeptide (TPR) repeat protein
MRRADELLVTSLKFDERRRYRRRIFWFSIGGLIMLTIVCALLLATSVETEKGAQLSQQGWDLWKQQKFDEAISKFEEAVKADPKNASGWNGLGWAQFNSGHYDKVEEAFKKVLTLEPKHPAALNGLGQLFLVQRKYDQAVKYLLQAAPQAPAAWYGLARVYLIQGKFDEAAKWAKKIVDSGDADDLAKQMLQAAQNKKLPDDLKRQIDPAGTPPQEVTQAWQLMNQGRREEAHALRAQARRDHRIQRQRGAVRRALRRRRARHAVRRPGFVQVATVREPFRPTDAVGLLERATEAVGV